MAEWQNRIVGLTMEDPTQLLANPRYWRTHRSVAEWQNRIVGLTMEDPTQLLANPRNWRTYPGPQRNALRDSLDALGWVQVVTVNDRTGNMCDGHARIEEAITKGEPTVPVLHIDVSEDEERLMLATLDPIGAMAGEDADRLDALLAEISAQAPGLQALLDSLATPDNSYTAAILAPQYTPTGEDPAPADLYDNTKTEQLRSDIRKAKLDEPMRTFLLAAAARHTIFNYRLIAEAYAHATPEVQRLFEESALVIIDFADAIRGGYVRLSKTLEGLEERDG